MRSDVVSGPLSEDVIDRMWLVEITEFLTGLLSRGITPLLVCEHGESRMKMSKREQRNNDRIETQSKIDELRGRLRGVARPDPSDVKRLRDLESTLKLLTKESRQRMAQYVSALGIPCILGDEGVEAERLATALTRYGVAAAVYSPDGDCLAHGCPLMIRGEGPPNSNGHENESTFEVIVLDRLLRDMDLDLPSFRDVCIMSGCDYNKNIPEVGFAWSYKFIVQYSSIDAIPEDVLRRRAKDKYNGIGCLLHDDCRQEFKDVHPLELMDSDVSLDEMVESGTFSVRIVSELESVMLSYGTERYAPDVAEYIELVPTPREFTHGAEQVRETRFGSMIVTTGDQLVGSVDYPAR
jgi:hypothetical protein